MKKNSQIYSLIKETKKLLSKKFFEKYQQDYNKLMISNIMWNAKEHLVSVFKDFLIYDELSEFFVTFFPRDRAIKKLKELFSYYNESSFIFPTYTPLPESKYIYKNIIKKQRVIDEQENLEELKKKQDKLKEKKKNIFFEFYNDSESQSKFFNSSIYNSILKPSESLIKILFGIDNENNIKNNSDFLNKNFIANNFDNDNDMDDEEAIENSHNIENLEEIQNNIKDKKYEEDDQLVEIETIIKVINRYEKKKSAHVSIKEFIKNNKNNNSKIRLKLGLLPNNNENNISIINRSDMGKIGKNILNNYKSNNYFNKCIIGNNNSGINRMKNSELQFFRNNNKKNNTDINNINKPLIINNYNYKNKNNNYTNRNANNFNEQKHKKIKSTFCFNESNYYNDYVNKLNINDKNDINKKYYKNDFNTPITNRTKTLDKNISNHKLNKKDKSIININININETNLYLNNNQNQNKNYFVKNKNYPKIIPKLDFNLINKNKFIKNKNIKKILNLNDLRNLYNNNYTERDLNKRNTPGKNHYKLNEKFKLMLAMNGISNNKINKIAANNDKKKSKQYSTENNYTLKIKTKNNFFKKCSYSNNNRNKKKNKDELIESINKIRISDFYTDRNDYIK